LVSFEVTFPSKVHEQAACPKSMLAGARSNKRKNILRNMNA
jgi:hypothetical protein